MKGARFPQWLLSAAIVVLLFGCQKLEDEGWVKTENGMLRISTRSTENDTIPYPMTLYAFSESGECEDTQIIKGKDEKITLELPPGSYRIVVVAGYSEGYVMPSKTGWEGKITLSDDGLPEAPLMMGMADIEVDSESESKVDILLSYVVTSIDVALSDIPTGVSEVEVTMSSFYSSVNLKGEYEGADYSLQMTCEPDTANRWVSKPHYVFPGSGEETVLSITLTMKDGTKDTYGYVWKDSPKANRPYHLVGGYAGSLVLNGTFAVSGWGESEEVKFDFGAVDQSDAEDGESGSSDIPEVGSFWKGTLVVDVGETDDSGTELLLMSLDEWSAVASQVEEVTDGYSVGEIAEWRLPTYEEAQLLKELYSDDDREALNERIQAYDEELKGLDGEERYLCDKSGEFYSFAFSEGTKISKAGEKKTYYVRLVKSYRIEG